MYYLSGDHRVNQVDIANSQENEATLCDGVNNMQVVDLLLDGYGTLVVMTDDGYVARNKNIRKLNQCERYYHLLRARRRFLCVGYDEDSSHMTLCTVSNRCSKVKIYTRVKVEYAPYCVTTAPLGDENGDQFLLFVGECKSSTRVSTYMFTRKTVHCIEIRELIAGREGKQCLQ